MNHGVFAVLRVFVSVVLFGALVFAQAGEQRIVVLHTSDLHGRVRRDSGTPGIAALAACIRKARAEAQAAGARVLVVDGGDFFQGTPEGDLTEGRIVIECMNEIGYDALCIGNHDLRLGPEPLARLASLARFPFLAANATRKQAPWIRESALFPDVQIAGLTAPEVPAAARDGLRVLDEGRAIGRIRWRAGAVRLLATHLGLERDRALAGQAGVAAILGGHDHALAAESASGVPIVHSLCHGLRVGRLELVVRDGAVVSASASHEKVDPDLEDPAVKAIVERGRQEIDRVMDRRVGRLAQPLLAGSRDRVESSPLGNFMTDVMREATGADIALHNRTAIRASLGKGVVRLRDLYQTAPFGDTVVTMTLAGKQVADLLEAGLSDGTRLLLEASGIEVEWDPKAEPGKRVVAITVAGKPLDPGKQYRVATNSLLAGGFRGRDVQDTQMALLDLLQAAIGKSGRLAYSAPNRIRAVRTGN